MSGMSAGEKMQVIGTLVEMGGHFGEAWHHSRNYKRKSKQTRLDAQARWNNIQMQARAMETDRIYNANLERRINDFTRGADREALAGSGLSGETLNLLQATADTSADKDVRERSRQVRGEINLLKHEQTLTMVAARNARKALRHERDLKVTNSIISGVSAGFSTSMDLMNNRISSGQMKGGQQGAGGGASGGGASGGGGGGGAG